MTPFLRFKDLFLIEHPTSVKLSKKFLLDLEKQSIKWYEDNFNAKYDLTKASPHRWYYTAGMATFEVQGLGAYTFRFIMQMMHFEFWNVPQFKEGFMYGRKGVKTEVSRDDNPYKSNFFYESAWDAGYICGLSNFKFNNNCAKKCR